MPLHATDSGGASPADLALRLESLPHDRRVRLWNSLPHEHRGPALSEMSASSRAVLIRTVPPEALAEAALTMELDDLADLLAELPEEAARVVLSRMGAREREGLRMILSFPADSAGGLMDLDVVTVRSDVTVAVALRFLRRRGHLPANMESLFALDAEGRFLGVIPLARLATADAEDVLESILQPYAPRIDPYTPAAEVARLFQDHDVLSAAVVDQDGRLLGRISSDDVVDVIAAQSETTVRRIAGLPQHDEVFASPLRSMAVRTPWLAFGLAGAVTTAFIVRRFEATIAEIAVIAALMPIVASMSGVAAMQTVTLTIRNLARGRITSENAPAVIRRELSIAMLGGLVLGVAVLVAVGLWLDHWGIGAAAGMALFLGFVAAGSIGILVPLTLHRLQIDPAPAAGLISTSTDAIGYGLLLLLGTLVLLW
jgi:magnesium transporter